MGINMSNGLRAACIVRAAPLLLSLAFALAGCADNPNEKFEDRESRLVAALTSDSDEFSSPPVWLVKTSSLSQNDRTAVFFGYVDNRKACEDFAEMYQERYKADKHRCVEMAVK